VIFFTATKLRERSTANAKHLREGVITTTGEAKVGANSEYWRTFVRKGTKLPDLF